MGLITPEERKTDLYGRDVDDLWASDRQAMAKQYRRDWEELITGAGLSNRRERETPKPGLLDSAARKAKDRSGRAGAGMPIFGSRASCDGGSMPWAYAPPGPSPDRGYVPLPDPVGGFLPPDRGLGIVYDRYRTIGSELEYALFGPGERGHPPKAKFNPRDFGHVLSLRGALQGLRQRGFISEEQSQEIWQRRYASWFVFPRTADDLLWDRFQRYATMLEGMRDFMDRWVKSGMDTSSNEVLEWYLIRVGEEDARSGRPELGKTDLERGKRIVAAAWAVFREFVNHGIATARDRSRVRFRHSAAAISRHDIWRSAYRIDPEAVQNEIALVVVTAMVHEPMHNRDKLWLYHSARGKWKEVDKGIGWKVHGDWKQGLSQLTGYINNVMMNTPTADDRARDAWDALLMETGLKNVGRVESGGNSDKAGERR